LISSTESKLCFRDSHDFKLTQHGSYSCPQWQTGKCYDRFYLLVRFYFTIAIGMYTVAFTASYLQYLLAKNNLGIIQPSRKQISHYKYGKSYSSSPQNAHLLLLLMGISCPVFPSVLISITSSFSTLTFVDSRVFFSASLVSLRLCR